MNLKKNHIRELLRMAAEVRENAYAPYSRFKVGAAALAEDGAVHTGCNVEVANLKGGTCAEGSAIAGMVSGGYKRLRAIAIVGSGDAICTPCGHCRQLIREFADSNTRIYVGDATGTYRKTYTIQALLPDSFGPGNLG